MKQKTRIALADDHALFRRGIANLLSEFDDIEVIFDVSNGKELQEVLPKNKDIDVILMDITMPVMDGYATTAWVIKNYPQINVLALSMFDEDMAVIGMLKAGAGGYVLKESTPLELYRAINEIKDKGVYLNEMVSGKMLRSVQTQDMNNKEGITLTERETEFIRLCVSELTYKEIADRMKIAPRSVENYRENLFEKLQMKSRVGLVLFAIKNGIVKI
ncbi:MAG TPA: response regulator transcription factor [Prolixibacteraceae bacterium]|jgi:DNA-binding NarL/FixJ family response regulator